MFIMEIYEIREFWYRFLYEKMIMCDVYALKIEQRV